MINKARAAVVDCRASQEIINNLLEYADRVILMPPSPRLSLPVASHADMLMWSCDNTILTYHHYIEIASTQFDALRSLGLQVIPVQEEAQSSYPCDVYLNCALLGSCLIANKRTASKAILRVAEENGVCLLHTNQGYAKCSVCVVSDNAIITADRSIHAAAEKFGIDSLLISEGGVALDGYDHGFIGGASGNDGDCVFFCGNIELHPDSERIISFIEKHGKQFICLSDNPLYDLGTIMFF